MKERQTGIHRSTYYLPLVRTYADALLRFQKTKPIRGRSESKHKWDNCSPTPCIPLGRREDVDTYSIRKTEEGDIQLINYRNPLLTFTPDNRIIIAPKYGSLMESGMIERVLQINAWLDRRKIGITADDERHVIEAGKTLTLKSEGECLSVDSKDTIYCYYVNRKKANNVRLQYSGFSQYLHGFLQLRKDMDNNAIQISLSEIADCIGYEYSEENVWRSTSVVGKQKVWKPDVRHFKLIDDKPQGWRCLWRNSEESGTTMTRLDKYKQQTQAFLGMVTNTQPDDTRTDNYYRATLTLLGVALGYIYRQPREGMDMSVNIPVSRVQKLWDDVVLKYHSDEMLDKRPLKPNQLPNDKYNRYITIMPTPEEIEEHKKREANI